MINKPKSAQLVIAGFILFALLAHSSILASSATKTDLSELDAVIQAQMAKHGIPGVALSLVEGDEIIYLKGYGTAGAHPMSPQTQMFIGSQSKSVTALVIAQLVDQGKINLEAPVQTYIPWFQVDDESASSQITVNHLLHHTSGLSGSGYNVILPSNATSEEVTRSLVRAKLTAPIGTQFQYFNEGYDVLAYIIELVSNQPYAEAVKELVFDPLGMMQSTAKPSTATNLSVGYTRLFGFAIPMIQPVRDYEIGAGYIISTAEDLAKYALAIKNGGEGLVSLEMYRKMFSPGQGEYGFGWHIVDHGRKIFHGGANETFATHVNIYPYDDKAFVLLINEGHQIDHFVSSAQLMQSVEAVVLGKTPPPIQEGWSVKWFGWAIGVLVLGLVVLHARNFYVLFHNWRERTRQKSTQKKVWGVVVSFMIPTFILIVVFSQVSAFYGNRFNLLTSLVYMRYGLPDIFILMFVGTLPDYIQGMIKLVWVMQGKLKPMIHVSNVESLRARLD